MSLLVSKGVNMLLLVLLASTSVVCSVSDVRRGVVPNRWLAFVVCVGTLLQATGFIASRGAYAVQWAGGMVLGDIIAILMYAAGFWAAGDAKLFMALYLCLPGIALDGLGLSAAIIPYLYIFIPAMLWLVVDTLWQAFHRTEKHMGAHFTRQQLAQICAVVLETTAAQAILAWVAPHFLEQNGLFCGAMLLIYAMLCAEVDALHSIVALVLHGVALLCAALFGEWRATIAPMWVYVTALLTLLFTRWASNYNYRRIETENVRAGMILSAVTVMRFSASRVHDLPQDASERMSARLTESQAAAVHRWKDTARGEPEVVIVRKMPFAVLISIGFVLWMMVRLLGWK